VNEAAVTLLGVIAASLLTVFGAIWRLGTKMGQMTQELADHTGRLVRLEDHMLDHDRWHMVRGDR
jgi:hypothetical protein